MDEAAEYVVKIDELHLDKECIRLPADYLKWATNAADKKLLVDEAKAALDLLEADLSMAVRDHPGKYGLDKVTESAIKGVVARDPKYLKAESLLNKARHQHDLAQAVVWALEHKKRSLTLLVELHGMGWAASVRPSPAAKEAVTERIAKQGRWRREDKE